MAHLNRPSAQSLRALADIQEQHDQAAGFLKGASRNLTLVKQSLVVNFNARAVTAPSSVELILTNLVKERLTQLFDEVADEFQRREDEARVAAGLVPARSAQLDRTGSNNAGMVGIESD